MGCGKVNQEMRSIKIFSASASSRETGFNMRRLGVGMDDTQSDQHRLARSTARAASAMLRP